MGARGSFLGEGMKEPKREADYSPLSSTEVKNDEAMPPLAHTTAWFNV
jgi:hypothetical protein